LRWLPAGITWAIPKGPHALSCTTVSWLKEDVINRFTECIDCNWITLLPESQGNWTDENNPAQVIDAYVDALDLARLGFDGVVPVLLQL
jgi:hypothetical protein